jgi:hypothetical protein
MKTNKLKQTFGRATASQRANMPIGESAGKPSAARTESRPATPETITEVAARIDIGLGNTLFIRGQGDGLNWDKGTPLVCKDASTWVWSTRQAKGKLVFKLLLNDVTWAQGEDLVVEAGRKIEVLPGF